MITCLSTWLLMFDLVTVMMQKNYSRQDFDEFDESYPKDALHLYAKNKPAVKRNEAILNDLPGVLYTGNGKIPHTCKYSTALIQAAQNQKQTKRGGLTKLLKLKIGVKVTLAVNLDIHTARNLVKLNLLKVVFKNYM